MQLKNCKLQFQENVEHENFMGLHLADQQFFVLYGTKYWQSKVELNKNSTGIDIICTAFFFQTELK